MYDIKHDISSLDYEFSVILEERQEIANKIEFR